MCSFLRHSDTDCIALNYVPAGVPDFLDPDSDNDGIPDVVETTADADLDGIPNTLDLDSDNDGIPDATEAGADPASPLDSDQDSTPDFRDVDSDDDSIADSVEAGSDPTAPLDTDSDGVPDYRDLDSDADSIPDAEEVGPDQASPLDSDSDGTPDFQDLDSDNDNIGDNIEAGPDPSAPVDTDGDGAPDYRDLDSDADTIPDVTETTADDDGDGVPNYLDGLDSDGDGILDAVEGAADTGQRCSSCDQLEADQQVVHLAANALCLQGTRLRSKAACEGAAVKLTLANTTATTIDTASEPAGCSASSGNLRWNDHVLGAANTGSRSICSNLYVYMHTDTLCAAQNLDEVPSNAACSQASQWLGLPDPDGTSAEAGFDGYPNGCFLSTATNELYFSTRSTSTQNVQAFPVCKLPATPCSQCTGADHDNDGTPNMLDLDSDDDNIPDAIEGTADTDGDGTPNCLDADSDNDGVLDSAEGVGDDDGDGVPNYLDPLDSDGDGISDSIEGTADADGDGVPNYLDEDSE
eukprot:COSAG02_NODE_2432_length_8873_cov_4.596991_3_plen_523_part_00